MTIISRRGKLMPASPIRKLVPYAEAAENRGKKVYYLNIGQPDISTPAVALNAIRNYSECVIEYSHSAGYESYRKGIAKFYQNIGIDIDYSHVMISTGASEAILFILLATMDPGDELIVPEPFYTNYGAFAAEASVHLIPVRSKIENDFALPTIDEIEKMISPRTKGVLICNPNNPTGYLYSDDELEKIRQLVIKYNLYLLADEVYREFVYDGKKHTSVLNLKGLEEHAIVIDSISKRYSMCGARTGCFITRNREVYDVVMKYNQARLSPPSLGQFAGEAALSTPPEYFKEVYDEYVERRNFIVNALNKIDGVYAPMPKGAFYTVIKLPVEDSEHFCKWILDEFDYNGQTVMLAPANGFYATNGLGKNEVRIAYVLKKSDLEQAVKCIEEALKVYPGKGK